MASDFLRSLAEQERKKLVARNGQGVSAETAPALKVSVNPPGKNGYRASNFLRGLADQERGRLASSGQDTRALEDISRMGAAVDTAALQRTINSPEFLQGMVDRQLERTESLRRQTAMLKVREADPTLVTSEMDTTFRSAKEAQAALDAAEAQLARLRTGYYVKENQGQLQSVARDQTLSQAYQGAEGLREGMEKIKALTGDAAYMTDTLELMDREKWKRLDGYLAELEEEYGFEGGKDRNALMELYRRLEEQQKPLITALEEAGYRYDRMSGYEQTLRDKAAYEERMADIARKAKENPVGYSLATFVSSPFQGVEYIQKMIRGAGTSDEADLENYVPMNVYDMDFTNFTAGVREEVAKNIEGSIDNEALGKAASFLYQTGMSIGDSAAQIATLGPASSWVMGANAASQQAREIILSGGTNRQAFWGGLAAGAAEKVFEKFSIDSLLAQKSVTGVRSLLKETAKQAGVEASEEMFTEVANILADTVIMGYDSQYDQSVRYYQSQGMSQEEARQRAFLDQVGRVGLAGLGGALSGGGMGGTVNTVNYISQRKSAASDTTLSQDGGQGQGKGMDASGAQGTPEARKTASTGEAANVRVGQATILKRPYQGEIPAQGIKANRATPTVSDDLVAAAQERISKAEQEAAQGVGAFKNLLTKAYQAVFRSTKQVPVEGLTFQGGQYYVDINNGVPGKVISDVNHAPEKLALLEMLPEVVTNGEFVGSTNGKAGTKIVRYDHFETPVTIHGKPALVLFETEVYPNANNYKTHRLINIELTPLSGEVTGTPPASAERTPALVNPTIAQPAGGVNTQYTQAGRGKIQQEGVSDGVHLHDGGQRADGADTGGPVPTVEGEAGRDQSGQSESRPADGGAASFTYGAKVSASGLGVPGGSTDRVLRIVTGGDTAATRAARQLAQERGLKLALFSGGNLTITDERGRTFEARAYIDTRDNTVYVRADHPKFTADQLMRHEAGHDMIAKGEIDPDAVRERLEESFGKESLDRLAEMYCEAYAGSGLTEAEIWEEIVCDSLGDINIFAGEQAEGAAAEQLGETRKAAGNSETAEARGPPAAGKASIEHDVHNRPFVVVEEDILAGVPRSQWIKTVKDNLRKKFPNGVHVGNNTIKINSQTRREATFSEYTQWLARNDKSTYADKFRATNYADEIILASRDYINEGLKHARRDNIRDFARGTVQLRVGERDYTADVVVGTTANGEMLLYDIVNLQPTIINERSRRTVQPNLSESRRSGAPASANSISNPGQNVNGKSSRETATPELTEEQQAVLSATQEAVRSAVREELDRMGREYGWIKPGEKPARDIQMPRRTAKDKKLSQTVRTVLEARATPESAIPTIEELAAAGGFSYEVYSDKQAIADAAAEIQDKGFASALADWSAAVGKGEVSKANTAMGWALYNNAANAGDIKAAMSVLTNMVQHQRSAAQAVQATRILKQMSPEAQLYGAVRSVENLQRELKERYGDRAPTLEVSERLAEAFLAAEDGPAREEAMAALYRDIGRQMPSRFIDKWNAWRYLAMLGNPRTHVRNVAGNLGFAPVVAAKNLTATAIEAVVSRVSGGRMGRTKAAVGFGKGDRALLKAAWGDFANVREEISGDGKYNDAAQKNKHIEEGRVIFKTKALETARRASSAAMEAEDMWFSRPHYAAALAGWCKANGITAEQLAQGKDLAKARAYAIREAQKATYRDTNAFSAAISELGRYRGKNPVGKGISVALEGILPFRKTPANILVRGMEYSPMGLLKGLSYDLYQVRQGNKTAAEAIDSISAGLTGTGLLALGLWAAAQGLIRGGGADEEKDGFKELMGHQAYALEVGDTSITLDWLAPECLPFFIGVNLWEQGQSGSEGVTMADMLTAVGNVTEPLLEMSCLQSLNDVFDAVAYASSDGLSALPTVLASAATSYLTQGLPTLLGQLERSSQNTRMTTYTEKDGFLTSDMQYALGTASGKIPRWDYNQIPYIDAWGRTEDTGDLGKRILDNMVNPAYTSTIQASPMEEELLRLYEQTGEGAVFPERAAKYFNVGGERLDLTAEQYVKYAQEKGQTSYDILTELTASKAYKGLSDTEKAEAVGLVYEYANAMAKDAVSKYKPEGWVAEAEATVKATGMSEAQYVTAYQAQKDIKSLKDADGETITNSKGLLIMEMVYAVPGLTEEQRKRLFEDFGVGKTVIGYSEERVKRELGRMRGR